MSQSEKFGVCADRMITTEEIKELVGCEQGRTINENLQKAGVPRVRLSGQVYWYYVGHVIEAINNRRNLDQDDHEETDESGGDVS